MKILYLDCGMGASGDMLFGALLGLAGSKASIIKKINSIGIPHVKVSCETLTKNGVSGNKVFVKIGGIEEHEHGRHCEETRSVDEAIHNHHSHHHEHRKLKDINHIISKLKISKTVKENAQAVYQILAQAESKAHGCEVSQIHFHEIGELDAIADIVGICMLIDEIGADKIIVSPINVGGGFVKCAHGVLPVPAPATTELLKGVPVYSGEIKEELCTPTGAAVLKHFAGEFGDIPQMKIQKSAYGFGSKEFKVLNAVRAFIGEANSLPVSAPCHSGLGIKSLDPESIVAKLECNLDDMTGEEIGFAFETILENGALDVWTAPIQMKKNRPGILFSVLCKTEQADFFAGLILKHTSTFGVRKEILSRYTLDRKIETKTTPYGKIRVKTGWGNKVPRSKAPGSKAPGNKVPFNIKKSKPEYEDIRRALKRTK